MWVLARNLGEILREFGEILGKYRILDDSSLGSKGLKSNVALLDTRDIPTTRRVGILFNIPKSNHYEFPRNPYYRCMSEWNGLRADTTLLPTRDSFKKAIVAGIPNPFVKVLH